jgi:hypothetical protein
MDARSWEKMEEHMGKHGKPLFFSCLGRPERLPDFFNYNG